MPYHVQLAIYAFLFILIVNKTSGICRTYRERVFCRDTGKMVKFPTLQEYQESNISFKYDAEGFRGHHVKILEPKIGELKNNTFLTMYSNWVMGLALSNRGISNVERGAFNRMACLRILDLSRNNITFLEKNFLAGTDNVQLVNLSRNGIYVLNNGTFESHCVLKEIDLSYNSITEIASGAFFDLHRLKRLRLNSNRLKEIDYIVFNYLNKLKFLDLTDNNLEHLSYTGFVQAVTDDLTTLNLSQNSLTELPKNLRFPNLVDLYLNNNNFEQLDVEWLKSICPNLKFININDNLFGCNLLVDIQKHLENHKIFTHSYIGCAILEAEMGSALTSKQDDSQHNRIGVGVGLLLCTILVYVLYHQYDNIQLWFYTRRRQN